MQDMLFDPEEHWQEEWKGMPEYDQQLDAEHHRIVVKFKTEEDMRAFAELVGQKVLKETKAIWYPKLQIRTLLNKRYVDESKA